MPFVNRKISGRLDRRSWANPFYLEVDDLVAAEAEIVDQVELPGSPGVDVDQLTAERANLEALRHELTVCTRRAAHALRAAGLSTRDVGEILGISGARVVQLDREVAGAETG